MGARGSVFFATTCKVLARRGQPDDSKALGSVEVRLQLVAIGGGIQCSRFSVKNVEKFVYLREPNLRFILVEMLF